MDLHVAVAVAVVAISNSSDRSKPKPGIIGPISSSSFLQPPISLKPIPGMYEERSSPSSHSSTPLGNRLRLYRSRILSPGRFLVQNLL
ncbi:hypothetical protein DERF_005313 [Dermatophagoides farinae]|uniref:Uncharacterized protein n=1 Tax=Dermatophagoides farinae TaxID=6954 RepID=A0A922L712_DERFA|nr:hypothetical protein DERF_005313 [Dermatophagoides farinae]